MNCYLTVEGEVGERRVYEKWINFINPSLTFVSGIANIVQDNYSIIHGGGYPNYFSIIENAIADINAHGNIDRYLIVVDSEDMTLAAKKAEVANFVAAHACSAHIHIIVQHYCLESWALGNRKVFTRQPQHPELRFLKNYFDVSRLDPSTMTVPIGYTQTRANFSAMYWSTLVARIPLAATKPVTVN